MHSENLILIVVAHPDDEVIGTSTLLIHHKNIVFVHITDGAPIDLHDAHCAGFDTRENYSHARYSELNEVFDIVNSGFFNSIRLNIIDQQAMFNIPGIIFKLIKVIFKYKPSLILTHAFEGGHPDHDTASFSVWATSRLLKRLHHCSLPVAEFASYHGNNNSFTTFDFIPIDHYETISISLNNEEQHFKRILFDTYKSQKKTIAMFPVHTECYRTQPDYDFLNPPHRGPLWYEQYNWGITKDTWNSCIHTIFTQLY